MIKEKKQKSFGPNLIKLLFTYYAQISEILRTKNFANPRLVLPGPGSNLGIGWKQKNIKIKNPETLLFNIKKKTTFAVFECNNIILF